MAEQFISKFDGTTSDNLLAVVNENQGVFPFDTELNESSSRGLPNSVIAKEINAIKDATSNNKGYFLTEESLKNVYSTAKEGNKAYVGNKYPYAIYLYEIAKGGWYNTGQTGGDDTFNSGEFYTKVQIDQQREAINDEISRVEKGANYEVLEYEVNIATTRLKVEEGNRKGGYMITYNPGTGWIKEQYIGNSVTNDEWIKDENWKTVLEDSGIQAIAEDARHQAQVAQASSIEAATQAQYAKEQAQAAQAVVGSIFESAPINTIMRTTEEAGNIFGENWLKCDGSQVSVIDYPLLKAKVSSSTWKSIENTYGITKCTYGNGIYVGVDINKTFVSKDGINWEEHEVSYEFQKAYISYFDGYFYTTVTNLAYENGKLFKSSDGVNWSEVSGFYEVAGLSNNGESFIKDIYSDGNYLIIKINSSEFGADCNFVLTYRNNIFTLLPSGDSDTYLWVGGSYGNLGVAYLTNYGPDSPSLKLHFSKETGETKTVSINSKYPEYVKYFENGWIGCEYINGKYVIAVYYYDNNTTVEYCAIFTTSSGEDLIKVSEERTDDSPRHFVNDKKRLLFSHGGVVTESVDGIIWNNTNIPPYGYYCRGDKMIIIGDASFGIYDNFYSIDNIQLPNIENHYIKAKQP